MFNNNSFFGRNIIGIANILFFTRSNLCDTIKETLLTFKI